MWRIKKEGEGGEESTNGTTYETEGGRGTAAPSSSDETHVVPPFDLMAKEFGKHHKKSV